MNSVVNSVLNAGMASVAAPAAPTPGPVPSDGPCSSGDGTDRSRVGEPEAASRFARLARACAMSARVGRDDADDTDSVSLAEPFDPLDLSESLEGGGTVFGEAASGVGRVASGPALRPESAARPRAGLNPTGSFGESSGVPLRRRRSPLARAAPAAKEPRAAGERPAAPVLPVLREGWALAVAAALVARSFVLARAADFCAADFFGDVFLADAFFAVAFFATAVEGAAVFFAVVFFAPEAPTAVTAGSFRRRATGLRRFLRQRCSPLPRRSRRAR